MIVCINAGQSNVSTPKVSALIMVRENTAQLNAAINAAKKAKAAELQYTDISGKVVKRYWNGATYSNKKSKMYEDSNSTYKNSGIYKAKFKTPNAWEESGNRR